MISCEKDLEDYICDNQEEFIEIIKNNFAYYNKFDIKFLGRQVRIGSDNIADLIYYYEDKVIYPETNELINNNINYIIVELKYRELRLEDLSQISRYMSNLYDKINNDDKRDKDFRYCDVFGIFVSFGLDDSFQEFDVAKLTEKIGYLKIKPRYEFFKEDYTRKEEYIENLELDKRIEELYEKPNEN